MTITDAPDMEPIQLGYSFRNIRVGGKHPYLCKLYEQASRFINRIRWKTFWYKKGRDKCDPTNELDKVFPTKRSAPGDEDLTGFESDFYDLLENIEFRRYRNSLMNQMAKDIKEIKASKKLILFADKSSNLYKIDKTKYDQLLHDNVTKDYKKTADNTINEINNEAADIIAKNNIKGKIPKFDLRESFVTVKDHKQNFPNKIECRLINPSKTYIARISKKILDRINSDVRRKCNLIQWRNTQDVIGWFNKIKYKRNKSFIKYDIEAFYPNITKSLLLDSINFARQYTNVDDNEIEIILHSCKTILFYDKSVWVKKNNTDNFDIPMGSLHGAEACEIVGLFLLNDLKECVEPGTYGLYRDDGLMVVKKSACEMERLSKAIRSIFAKNGLKITIEIGLKRVEFLDVIMDLRENSFRPYKKPNSETVYMSKLSNHPNYIKKQIPLMVNNRLNTLSKRKSDFDYVKPNYQDALKKSNYDHELKHYDSKDQQAKKRKKRQRKIIYFQPPFSLTVKTPIGRSFLKLIKKHFHPKHPLHKILNHRCIKLSYSCLGNIKSEIASSNKSLMYNEEQHPKLCNCRKPEDCPLDGKCLIKNIIYKAEITSGNSESKVYIGSAGSDFKQRYTNHKSSLKYSSKRKTTELSKFYWELKDAGITPNIKWSVIKEIRSGYSLKNGCTLCNTEKYLIACAEKQKLLNKRNELKRVCPHYSSAFF